MACSCGECIWLHSLPLSSAILYRQHSANVIGSQGLGWRYWWHRFKQWSQHPVKGGHTFNAIRQIHCFEHRYGIRISPLPLLIRLGRRQRLAWLLTNPISQWPRKHGTLRTLAFYVQFFCF